LPDFTPGEVARIAAECLAFPGRHEDAARLRLPCELRDQARLAHAGVRRDPDHGAISFQRGVEPGPQQAELGRAADHRQFRRRGFASLRTLDRRRQRIRVHGLASAFYMNRRKLVPCELAARGIVDRGGDEDLSVRCVAHEPRGDVDGVAETRERLPMLVAVHAAPQAPVRDADLQLGHSRDLGQLAQLQRRRQGARRVVLVRLGRTKNAVQIGSLVAYGKVHEIAAVGREDTLHVTHERIELRRSGIVVVVDAAEPREQRVSGAQLRHEFAASGPQTLVERRKHPSAGRIFAQRIRTFGRGPLGNLHQRPDDGRILATAVVMSHVAHDNAIAQDIQCRLIQNHLSRHGAMLRGRKGVDQATGEHIDQLHIRIADDKPARRSHRDSGLHRERYARAARRDDVVQAAHRVLHREAAGGRTRAVVAIEPARDGVAAEIDDLTAEAMELLDQGMKNPVQMLRQLFGPAVRAKLGGQRLGQRGEAGDVREKCRTVNAVGHGLAARERPAAVARNVSLKVLQQFADAHCARH